MINWARVGVCQALPNTQADCSGTNIVPVVRKVVPRQQHIPGSANMSNMASGCGYDCSSYDGSVVFEHLSCDVDV